MYLPRTKANGPACDATLSRPALLDLQESVHVQQVAAHRYLVLLLPLEQPLAEMGMKRPVFEGV